MKHSERKKEHRCKKTIFLLTYAEPDSYDGFTSFTVICFIIDIFNKTFSFLSSNFRFIQSMPKSDSISVLKMEPYEIYKYTRDVQTNVL